MTSRCRTSRALGAQLRSANNGKAWLYVEIVLRSDASSLCAVGVFALVEPR